jgi:hypothetical protein
MAPDGSVEAVGGGDVLTQTFTVTVLAPAVFISLPPQSKWTFRVAG